MKVAFIGTHGVGKTTLCFELAAVLKREGIHVDIVKEVARLSPLPINQKTSLDAQSWIFFTQMAEEIRAAHQNDVVVCDRSVLDNYAYLMLACGRQLPIERFMHHWMKSYDLLFKVPFSGHLAASATRTPSSPRPWTSWWTSSWPSATSPTSAWHRAPSRPGSSGSGKWSCAIPRPSGGWSEATFVTWISSKALEPA